MLGLPANLKSVSHGPKGVLTPLPAQVRKWSLFTPSSTNQNNEDALISWIWRIVKRLDVSEGRRMGEGLCDNNNLS